MQIPEKQEKKREPELIDVDRADFAHKVAFGNGMSTQRAHAGRGEVVSMKADARNGLLFVSAKVGHHEIVSVVPFNNVLAYYPADPNRPSVQPPPRAPVVEVKPTPRPVVSDVVKL